MHAGQLREFIVRPVLRYLAPAIPYSEGAVELLMGTAAQESGLQYLDQLSPGPGPAYGLWQMEQPTHDDHWRWMATRPAIHSRVTALVAIWPGPVLQLHSSLLYAAAMCRVHYYRTPEAIPAAQDVAALGALWKKRYNTHLGKGTVAEFIANYRRLCA